MTQIEWTDETWNPVTGCTKVSPGCKNCYAERIAKRFYGENGFDLKLHPDRLEKPLRWRKPRMVFVNSMSDLFHEDIPAEYIFKVIAVMEKAEKHTFQVLTKRPERARDLTRDLPLPKNVWMGVSVENEDYAYRIEVLKEIPASTRFISFEPLLGPVDHAWNPTGIDWIIVGGESGPKRRPFDPDWARALYDDCIAWDIPFFMKQWDKVQPIPDDLMIREWPV